MKREQHGARRTALYAVWTNMKARCLNPRNPAFQRYGGRGIGVCDRWRESFTAFREDMGEPPSGMTLDRIDNNGPYSPENCRWATPADQSANRRSVIRIEINGTTRTMTEWARLAGLSPQTVWSRLRAGWNPEQAVTTPPVPQRMRNCGARHGSEREVPWCAASLGDQA